jgi:hypothetical protein
MLCGCAVTRAYARTPVLITLAEQRLEDKYKSATLNRDPALPRVLEYFLMMNTIHSHAYSDSLDVTFLESPIPSERQEKIVTQFWGSTHTYKIPCFRLYFQYYTEQCRIVYQSHGTNLAIRTHRHIAELASRIQAGIPRSEVYEFVEKAQWASAPASIDSINASIDLTARLLYMLDIGEFRNGHSGRNPLLWVQGSLQEFVQEKLTEANSEPEDGIRFEKSFNLIRMVGIAGFNVELTSNLSDHLRFRDSDKTVKIFHHASFLEAHKQYVSSHFGFCCFLFAARLGLY